MKHWHHILKAMCGAALLLASFTSKADEQPAQIASLDYCSDQFVLALAPRETIASLSRDADSVFSFFADQAAGLAKNRGSLEEILHLRPTLLVRQWQGSTAMDGILNQAGIATIALPFAASTDAAYESMLAFGEAIGQRETAKSFVASRKGMQAELSAAKALELKALYVTPSGFTAGTSTGVDAIIENAGLTSIAHDYGLSGWGPLPLEAIVRQQPDIIIASLFDLPRAQSNWSLAGHPKIAALMENVPVINLPARFTACSTLFATDAAYHIRKQADALAP